MSRAEVLTLVIERKGRPFAELVFAGDPDDEGDLKRIRQTVLDEIRRRGWKDWVEEFTLTVKAPGDRRGVQVALR